MLNIRTQPPPSHSLFRDYFAKPSEIHKRLGQFDYRQPNCITHHIKKCFGNSCYGNWVYIGEVKEGTYDTPHGIGIRVWYGGSIDEGYWKDGELHGRGRVIYGTGNYYIGEWQRGSYNGEGTYYQDGDKYTGQWHDYKGQGEINYTDGTEYTGHWDWFIEGGYKRHGFGTLYSADGQVLNQGKWEKDKYIGKE